MLNRIREERRRRGLTLEDVAARCRPPTTPQTIGRLETGTRTLSLPWLNRIAAALDAPASSLVRHADEDAADLPVAARLGPDGAVALRSRQTLAPPAVRSGMVAVQVAGGVGDYRAGDEVWLERLEPDAFAAALNRDVLAPRPVGRFLFGRLLALDDRRLHLLPPGHGARQQVIDRPAWIARAVRLVRPL